MKPTPAQPETATQTIRRAAAQHGVSNAAKEAKRVNIKGSPDVKGLPARRVDIKGRAS